MSKPLGRSLPSREAVRANKPGPMASLGYLIVAGGVFGVLVVGQVLRSVVVRRLAAALSLVGVAALLRWGAGLGGDTPARPPG